MGSKKENKNEKAKHKGTSSNKPVDCYKSQTSSTAWWIVFSAILILSAATRFYKVSEPDHVVWDETHFGKFASWYINQTFFFDVHPPLGKMLIGGIGYLTGYDGAFPFIKPGDKYDDVQYLGMRLLCTGLGAALVPFAFIIVWEMTRSLSAATLSSSLILFDIGLLTLNQYILLDPILLFFIMGSVMGLVKFRSCKRAFSIEWWAWLAVTGFMLSGSISVKFVGLFVVLYVGIHTIKDLWDIYGNLNNSMMHIINHFAARVIGLIILPAVLYLVYFFIHFSVLTKTGNGDGFYSSAFQSQLEGNSLFNASMPLELAYGAEISLKNARTGGGYLHSHIHLYPEGEGARQQQITTYSHKDFNNKWLVKKWNEEPGDFDDEEEPTELVKNGDLIRLEHVPTGRNVHSHREPAPVTKRHFQVTGYGENGEGDINDVWRVEIINGKEEEIVKTVVHKLKFTHYLVSCSLTSHNKQLPKWGFEQMEVTCAPSITDGSDLWNIEENLFPKLPNTTFNIYGPSFLEKFIESHTVMLQGNSGLKPKEGEVTSQPWQWPINYRGQWFSAIEGYRVYLLGNPIIWWGNLVVMALFVVVYAVNLFRTRRGYKEKPQEKEERDIFLGACGWLIVAWAMHYLPFFFMGRILYFHHYFPALLFSSMLTGITVDYIFRTVPSFLPKLLSATVYHILAGTAYSVLIYSFYIFSPLAYGTHNITSDNENSTLYGLKWLDTWEF